MNWFKKKIKQWKNRKSKIWKRQSSIFVDRDEIGFTRSTEILWGSNYKVMIFIYVYRWWSNMTLVLTEEGEHWLIKLLKKTL